MSSRQTHAVALPPVPDSLRTRYPHQVPLSELVREPSRDHLCLFADKRLGKCTLATEWVLTRPTNPTAILVVAPLSSSADWLRNLKDDGQHATWLSGNENQRAKQMNEFGYMAVHRDAHAGEFHYVKPTIPKFVLTNPQGLYHVAKNGRVPCPKCQLVGFPVFGCVTCGGRGVIAKSKNPVPTYVAMFPWDAVIWDESVLLRNPKNQVNQVAHACFGDVNHRAILTGEPTPEDLMEIFEQMRWCFGTFMGHKNYYRWRHEYFMQEGYDWVPRLGSLEQIKLAVRSRGIFLTRRQAGVKETWKRTIIKCQMPDNLSEVYAKCEREFCLPQEIQETFDNKYSLLRGKLKRSKYVIVIKSWLSILAGGCCPHLTEYRSQHKIQPLKRLITERFVNEKIIVSFRFNAELDRVALFLRKWGVPFAQLRGGMSVAERAAVGSALRDGKVRVLLCQTAAIKYGADLSAANVLIRYSIPHSWDTISQAMDRIVHTAKKDVLQLVDLVSVGTVDEDVIAAISEKGQSSRGFMESLNLNLAKRRRSYNG